MRDPAPLITIAIPTYNRAHSYFPQALKSALDQDYPNLEIIICDNASTDGTEAIVRRFADPRIRYFRQERTVRQKDNSNRCVMEAKGVYFLLLHDDDLVDPDFISACMNAAQGRLDLGVIRTGIRIINGKGQTMAKSENRAADLPFAEFVRCWFSNQTAFYLANTIYSTRALQSMDGFRSKHDLFDDVVALVRLAAVHGRADVKDIKASFRRHDSNSGSSTALVMNWAEDCIYLRDLILELTPLDQRDVIRREATVYLCRKAYIQTRNIPNLLRRLRICTRIYPMFDYAYSPLEFFWTGWRARLRRVSRAVARRLASDSKRREPN